MNLIRFLRTHRWKEESDPEKKSISHVCLPNGVVGKFTIDEEDIDEFWTIYNDYYKNCILNNKQTNFGICEIISRTCSPILVDIDFDQDDRERKYTNNDITNLVIKYKTSIQKIIDLSNVDDSRLEACVFEKTEVRCKKKDGRLKYDENGNLIYKDGLHLIFKEICVNFDTHIAIHKHTIDLIKNELPPTLNHLGNNIIDTTICDKNWLIYGCLKPHEDDCYRLTARISHDNIWHPVSRDAEIDPREFSVVEKSLREFYCEPKPIQLPQTIIANFVTMEPESNTEINDTIEENEMIPDLDIILKLLDMLSFSRCDIEDSWNRVGIVLYNIDKSLLNVWKNWSKKSPKYEEAECDRRWCRFHGEKMSIGTLHMWAQQDNPEKYDQFKSSHYKMLLNEAISTMSNFDVAKVLQYKYNDKYICSSLDQRKWWCFVGHRWMEMQQARNLKIAMSTEFCKDLTKLSHEYAKHNNNIDKPDPEIKKKQENCINLIGKLKNNSHKESITKECGLLFFDSLFSKQKDENTHLIGFENGVYDIQTLTFRPGKPSDYITFSTKTMYVKFSDDDPIIMEIKHFLNCVIPDSELQTYILKLLASFLDGSNREQKCHIWTGTGANGKSTLIDLYRKSIGDYAGNLPISLLTKQRAQSNAASPEIDSVKGKRFASLQEPDQGDKINVGLMKELSGGDTITSRGLYNSPEEWTPQFKMLLTCNHLPDISATDDGTWRRLRVCEFKSKFVDHNPNIDRLEFQKDKSIVDKIPEWKDAFMFMLIQNLEDYKKNGIHEPEVVLSYTKQFQLQNDQMSEFLSDAIEITNDPSDKMSKKQLFEWYAQWMRDNYKGEKSMLKNAFNSYWEQSDKIPKRNGDYINIRKKIADDYFD